MSNSKLGIFGYCMGGALALRASARFPDQFAAVASFHTGGLVSDEDESPHKILPQIRASMYVAHADQDPHMSADQIKTFDEAMSHVKVQHRPELFAGIAHHFTMADLPAYDVAASERHWQNLVRLFEAAL